MTITEFIGSIETKLYDRIRNSKGDAECRRLLKEHEQKQLRLRIVGVEYTDNPRLKNQDDLYYTGCGCTWDTDLDGIRFWKRYSSFLMEGNRYSHLSHGDIINEKARMKKLIKECLSEMDY
jgi:hypothetical protein